MGRGRRRDGPRRLRLRGIGGEYGQGNVNCSLLDDPAIDDAMTAASTIPAGDERSQAWADVHGVINGYTTTWDLTYRSLE
jgi:hypothetical protein